MNILPKKNWHVRTQKNIDRVRKDEAKAAEEEAELERRSKLAEQEARTRMLRDKARSHHPEIIGPSPEENGEANVTSEVQDSSGHINFFQDIEKGEGRETGNKEHEEEKKREQEEYETKVGYLVKLGQDTEELTGETVWWKKPSSERLLGQTPSQLNSTTAPLASVREKQKDFLDPLNNVRKYLGCEGVRLTLKRHEQKLETEEKRAINFEPFKKKKRKRSRSRSSERKKKKKRSRSNEKKKRKRSRSRERSRSRSNEKKKRKRSRSREGSRSRESSYKKSKKKKKKSKVSSSSSDDSSSSGSDSDQEKKALAKKNLEKMRRERLERERLERQKADRLVFGECEEDKKKKKEEEETAKKQKYSSQFNPDIAKQNKLDPKRKYWLE